MNTVVSVLHGSDKKCSLWFQFGFRHSTKHRCFYLVTASSFSGIQAVYRILVAVRGAWTRNGKARWPFMLSWLHYSGVSGVTSTWRKWEWKKTWWSQIKQEQKTLEVMLMRNTG